MRNISDLNTDETIALRASLRIMICCVRKLNDDGIMIGMLDDRVQAFSRIVVEFSIKNWSLLLDENYDVSTNNEYHISEVRDDCKMLPIALRFKVLKYCEDIMVHNYHHQEIKMLENIKMWLTEIP